MGRSTDRSWYHCVDPVFYWEIKEVISYQILTPPIHSQAMDRNVDETDEQILRCYFCEAKNFQDG